MEDPVRKLYMAEIRRIEKALRFSASGCLRKYLKRLREDLRDYDRAIKRLEI